MEHYDNIDLKGNNLQNVNAIENVSDGVITNVYGQDSSGDLVKDPNPPVRDFTDIDDAPNDYTGEGGKIVAVKSTEDGLEFVAAPSGSLPSGTASDILFHDGTNWAVPTHLKVYDNYLGKHIQLTANSTYYGASINNSSSGVEACDLEIGTYGSAPVAIRVGNGRNTIGTSALKVYQDGSIESNPLAGTGDRPVLADSDGKLKTDDTVAVVKRVKRTLTPDEIRSLHTTPIEIIPAPGANKTISIQSALMKYNYDGANVYTTISGDAIELSRQDDGSGYEQCHYTELDISDKTIDLEIIDTRYYSNYESISNKAIYVTKNSFITDPAYTGATATGTVDIIVDYTIMDFN